MSDNLYGSYPGSMWGGAKYVAATGAIAGHGHRMLAATHVGGTGTYLVNLESPGIDTADCVILASLASTDALFVITAKQLTDTTISVVIRTTGGVATDNDFSIAIFRTSIEP
jgi:hypothetical protein